MLLAVLCNFSKRLQLCNFVPVQNVFIVYITFLITARKRSLGQGNIFAPVLSFCSEEGSTLAGTPPPSPGRYTPQQVHLPGQVHPLGRYTPWQLHSPGQVHPQAGTPPGRYTPWQCMLGYGQHGGGTHPTGMHSCWIIDFG